MFSHFRHIILNIIVLLTKRTKATVVGYTPFSAYTHNKDWQIEPPHILQSVNCHQSQPASATGGSHGNHNPTPLQLFGGKWLQRSFIKRWSALPLQTFNKDCSLFILKSPLPQGRGSESQDGSHNTQSKPSPFFLHGSQCALRRVDCIFDFFDIHTYATLQVPCLESISLLQLICCYRIQEVSARKSPVSPALEERHDHQPFKKIECYMVFL